MKGGATAGKKPGSSGGQQKAGNSATRQQKVKAISGDTAGNPAEVKYLYSNNKCLGKETSERRKEAFVGKRQ